MIREISSACCSEDVQKFLSTHNYRIILENHYKPCEQEHFRNTLSDSDSCFNCIYMLFPIDLYCFQDKLCSRHLKTDRENIITRSVLRLLDDQKNAIFSVHFNDDYTVPDNDNAFHIFFVEDTNIDDKQDCIENLSFSLTL